MIVPPAVGLDGADGHPRWSAQTSLARSPIPQIAAGIPDLLDAGDASRLPRLLDHSIGSTACLLALPTTSVGTLAPPQGRLVPPGPTADDPRWARPLPWAAPILRNIGLTGFLAATGLALVNVLLPIALLRLAARRRPWTVRLLMAVPLAVAVPLMVFRARETLLPEEIGTLPLSARSVFVLDTLAGLPIVVYAVFAVWSLVRRRWRTVAVLAALTILARRSSGPRGCGWIGGACRPSSITTGRTRTWPPCRGLMSSASGC